MVDHSFPYIRIAISLAINTAFLDNPMMLRTFLGVQPKIGTNMWGPDLGILIEEFRWLLAK